MSLVDIPLPTAEDQNMDPAFKQYVDSSLAVSEARQDAKLAEFRAIVEAYTARADERDAAAREREQIRHHDLERRMQQFEIIVAGVKRAVITTGIAATLSTVFGVAAFNAALIQNVQQAFEAGRQASPAQITMQSEIRQIQAGMLQMQTNMDRMQTDIGRMQSQITAIQTDIVDIKRQMGRQKPGKTR